MKLYEKLDNLPKLTESLNMSLDEFLNNIKDIELSFYREQAKVYQDITAKGEDIKIRCQQTDNFDEWWEFIKSRNETINDYDVADYCERVSKKGEAEAERHLNYILDEHITKLKRSITKVVGKGETTVTEISTNTYTVDGEEGTCTIDVSPIKLSSSKSVTKTRIKVSGEAKKEKAPEPKTFIDENEYIKEWKQQEFDSYIKCNEEFWDKVKVLDNIRIEAKNKLEEAVIAYRNTNGQMPEVSYKLERGRRISNYSDPELQRLFVEYYNADTNLINHKQSNKFFLNYGREKNFEDRCRKAINDHFKLLQDKVERKIGKIVKIFPLNGSKTDYRFEGELDNCIVEVILAGGYNIQRLHTRWIVKKNY